MFTKSIRGRLLLWLGFLLVCTLTAFGVTAYQLHRANEIRQFDEELQHRLAALSGNVVASLGGPPPLPPFHLEAGPPGIFPAPPSAATDAACLHLIPNQDEHNEPGPDNPFPASPEPPALRLTYEVLRLFDQHDTNSYYFAIWNRDGSPRLSSSNAPANLQISGRARPENGPQTHMRGMYRESFLQLSVGYQVLVGRTFAPDLKNLQDFGLGLIAIGVVVLAIGLIGGWRLTDRALRPVEDISAAASRISAGNLSERINVADTDDELGRLARVLNSTFARLEAAFARQKQFTADASHELRTPIAVLISEAQTALARQRSAGEYRETVEACLDTAQQMRRLTESLLELARFDAGQEPIRQHPIKVADIVRSSVELIRPLAAEGRLQIHCDLAPVETYGNADHLGRVMTNLLSNAIHHNKPGGEIHITTRPENGGVVITVADTGEGIAPEDLPHIFERFYRADKSRSQANGRTGLGLAICKAIVEAHGGSIQVASQPGTGTTFTVRLGA